METANMGRRLFLRNLGALAALAVTSKTLIALQPDDVDRILAMMRMGLVRDQTFLVTRPIVLDFVDGLLIDRCTFVARFNQGPIFDIRKAKNVTITNCVLRYENAQRQ